MAGRDRNEWATAIQDALAPGDVQPANAPPAFSLGDRAVTTSLLSAAGFASINFAQVHEPVFHGPSIDAAHDAIVDLFLVKTPPAGAKTTAHAALPRLRALLEAHLTADGVFFDSRAWIVTARRADERPAL